MTASWEETEKRERLLWQGLCRRPPRGEQPRRRMCPMETALPSHTRAASHREERRRRVLLLGPPRERALREPELGRVRAIDPNVAHLEVAREVSGVLVLVEPLGEKQALPLVLRVALVEETHAVDRVALLRAVVDLAELLSAAGRPRRRRRVAMIP